MRETAVYLDHAATTLPEAEVLEAMAQAQRAAETFCDMAFCHACAGIGNAEQM